MDKSTKIYIDSEIKKMESRLKNTISQENKKLIEDISRMTPASVGSAYDTMGVGGGPIIDSQARAAINKILLSLRSLKIK